MSSERSFKGALSGDGLNLIKVTREKPLCFTLIGENWACVNAPSAGSQRCSKHVTSDRGRFSISGATLFIPAGRITGCNTVFCDPVLPLSRVSDLSGLRGKNSTERWVELLDKANDAYGRKNPAVVVEEV